MRFYCTRKSQLRESFRNLRKSTRTPGESRVFFMRGASWRLSCGHCARHPYPYPSFAARRLCVELRGVFKGETMDDIELIERALAFVKSLQAGRVTMMDIESTIDNWISGGFLSEDEGKRLLDMVVA